MPACCRMCRPERTGPGGVGDHACTFFGTGPDKLLNEIVTIISQKFDFPYVHIFTNER